MNSTNFLLDECISIHFPHSFKTFNSYAVSRIVVGRGADDAQVLKYAQQHKLTLVTSDIRLALLTILANHPIVFCSKNGKKYHIKPSIEEVVHIGKLDSITKYLLEQNETIIVP